MDTTESMARQKLCCRNDDSYCAGSLCMAWRWQRDAGRQRIYCSDPGLLDDTDTVRPERARFWVFAPWDGSDYPAQWLEPEADYQARRRGYCGLAGGPVVSAADVASAILNTPFKA